MQTALTHMSSSQRALHAAVARLRCESPVCSSSCAAWLRSSAARAPSSASPPARWRGGPLLSFEPSSLTDHTQTRRALCRARAAASADPRRSWPWTRPLFARRLHSPSASRRPAVTSQLKLRAAAAAAPRLARGPNPNAGTRRAPDARQALPYPQAREVCS